MYLTYKDSFHPRLLKIWMLFPALSLPLLKAQQSLLLNAPLWLELGTYFPRLRFWWMIVVWKQFWFRFWFCTTYSILPFSQNSHNKFWVILGLCSRIKLDQSLLIENIVTGLVPFHCLQDNPDGNTPTPESRLRQVAGPWHPSQSRDRKSTQVLFTRMIWR